MGHTALAPRLTTIQAHLQHASLALQAHSTTPRLDAELLLSHVLQRPRSHLHAWPDAPLDNRQSRQFQALLKRRMDGYPMAYLTGHQEFWSLRLQVTPHTLIPRPETELLVEQALQHLPPDHDSRVLDLGTGSGAIALALASERPKARITATDADPQSLQVARNNAAGLQTPSVRFIQSHWFADLPENLAPFDLIVSNPPYVQQGDPHLQTLQYEPLSALCPVHDDPTDGLSALREIITQAPYWLKPGGSLILEHGFDQQPAVVSLCHKAGFTSVTGHRDLAGHPRIVCAQTETA